MTPADRLTLRNVYLYLVCLVTLVMSIFAAVNLVRDTVELLYPDPGYFAPAPEKDAGLSEEQQQRAERLARESQRRQAVLGLVGSATLLLVAGPLYGYHWRRVQRELPGRAAPSPAGPPPPGN